MNVIEKREAIKRVYPHKTAWVDNMPEQQVVAIFLRLANQGKLKR